MSDYPDAEEEFELQYGEELELLTQHEDYDEPVQNYHTNTKTRRSLNYGDTKTTHSNVNTQSDLFASQSQLDRTQDNSFSDFQPISDVSFTETTVESTADDPQLPASSQKVTEPTKKRTIEELFGDINDLLFDNNRTSKKQKATSKYEEQLGVIEEILELRRLKRESDNEVFRLKKPKLSNEDRNKMNLSWRIPNYPFMSITRHDNEKFYVRCHSDDYEKEDITRVVNDINFVGVMGDLFKETWKKAQEIINKELDDRPHLEEDIIEIDDQNLWVDLYKPRRYLELLSDETTNRILLKWVKLWDKAVFNRRPKIKPVENSNNQFQKIPFKIEDQLKLDEDGRPRYKVALLCGKPGLGKTTLAHIVAKQAGYNVIEINASDDRSIEFFKTSLENATQMRSIVDQQKRPNCVVFDEIDGAPSASIDFLVKFVSGTASKGKKKDKKTTILKRPIICICNDAYVPALRALRQIAFIIHFPPTSSGRLSERLMEIAKKQQLKTDIGTMLALAEKSSNDIRSCLGILHFYKAQQKPVTLSDVYRSNVGQKDMQNGLFSVWTDIFSIERAKPKFSGVQTIPKEDRIAEYDMSYKARMQKILDVVQAFGDYNRLAQGVFENFPELQIKEASLNGTCHALDWFCYSDKLNKAITSQQEYSLTTYLPYAFVVWHFRFSSLTWPKIKYPNENYEVRQKLTNNLAAVKELEKGMQPKMRIFVNSKNLIMDVLPFLTRIISPPLRPVNLHLFTKKEKEKFSQVVEIMIDYNLNYIQEKNSLGVYEFKLDPDILPIVTFPNVSTSSARPILSYFNKQLIAREVELGKIRKFQLVTDKNEEKNNDKDEKNNHKEEKNNRKEAKNRAEKQKPEFKSPEDQKNLPNHLQKLKVKSVKKVSPKTARDFFGRIIQNAEENNKDTKGPQLNNDILFKYKEGYSNAVRKKVKMSSLINF